MNAPMSVTHTASTEQSGMREGAALVRASNAYATESRARTWFEFFLTFGLMVGSFSLAVAAPWVGLQVVGSVLLALLNVRMFIIFHDALHGAVFRKSKAGDVAMFFVGLYTLAPKPVWKETHDYHHKNNCKLPGTAIGSYPIVTTRMWRRMKPKDRRMYRYARHPLTMLFGYFTIFMAGMIGSAFLRNPKLHWQNVLAVVFHFSLMAAVGFTLGPLAAFLGVFLPTFISSALGSYLFYAQHNYPGVFIADRQRWNYHQAALASSSMFDMSPVMHFFTGNIGYHHIHHLNHRIPFYRLPQAMAELPELQSPGRTTWKPSDIAACLQLKLWDPSKKEMVPFPDAA